MKITKTQLKQIIKEEIDSALEEYEIDENMLKKFGASVKKVGLDAMAGLGIGGEYERRKAANPNYGLSKSQISSKNEKAAFDAAQTLINRAKGIGVPETLYGEIDKTIAALRGLGKAYRAGKIKDPKKRQQAEDYIAALRQIRTQRSTSSAFNESDKYSETLTRIVREEIEAVLAEAADPQSFVGTLDQLPDSVIGGDVPGADEEEDDQKRRQDDQKRELKKELCKKAGVRDEGQMKDCLRVGLERWQKSYKGQYRSDRPRGKHAYDAPAGQAGRISVNQMYEDKQ